MYYTGTHWREEQLMNVKIYSQLESRFKLFHHDSLVKNNWNYPNIN